MMHHFRRMIKRMGFVRDQEGIMNRYLRERSNWESHLARTRGFISTSFVDCPAESIAVLGSGWLLDVPLDDLCRRFKRVFLVDIHHPPQIRRKVRDFDRVELVTADLSGGAVGYLWDNRKSNEKNLIGGLLNRMVLENPLPGLQPDAYASVNLLNQMDILLCDYLKKDPYYQQKQLSRFRKRIQSFHLEWITGKPGCLITDTVEVNRDRQGTESVKSLLYTTLPPGIRSEQWNWEFDTMKTYRSGMRTRMEVRAVEWG
jgi:hypothetical protein